MIIKRIKIGDKTMKHVKNIKIITLLELIILGFNSCLGSEATDEISRNSLEDNLLLWPIMIIIGIIILIRISKKDK